MGCFEIGLIENTPKTLGLKDMDIIQKKIFHLSNWKFIGAYCGP
jgi:hypothetical protein